jgi:hypothetical protein
VTPAALREFEKGNALRGHLNYTCYNLNNLKHIAERPDYAGKARIRVSDVEEVANFDTPLYKEYYECIPNTPVAWQGNDYKRYKKKNSRTFVNDYVNGLWIKPDWFWEGPVPGSRIFVLAPTFTAYKYMTSLIYPTLPLDPNVGFATGINHCNQDKTTNVFTLVEIPKEEDLPDGWVKDARGYKVVIEKYKEARQKITDAKEVYDATNQQDTPRLVAVLGKKPYLEWRDDDRQTALFRATLNGDTECLRILIKEGANVNVTDKDGSSPCYVAAIGPHSPLKGSESESCLALLIAAKADVNQALFGLTPCLAASKDGKCVSLEMLIKGGADVNATDKYDPKSDKYDWTSCNYAAENVYPKCLDLLIKAGADVNYYGRDGYMPINHGHQGYMPIIIERERKHVECWDLLAKAGCKYKGPLTIARHKDSIDDTSKYILANAYGEIRDAAIYADENAARNLIGEFGATDYVAWPMNYTASERDVLFVLYNMFVEPVGADKNNIRFSVTGTGETKMLNFQTPTGEEKHISFWGNKGILKEIEKEDGIEYQIISHASDESNDFHRPIRIWCTASADYPFGCQDPDSQITIQEYIYEEVN